MTDFVIRGAKVLSKGTIAKRALWIDRGKIEKVTEFDDVPAGLPIEECGELVVMPGLVDSHVHINEPGREEWEGFLTATAAAAAGGVTTIVDMPLNSIPTTISLAALETKRSATIGKLAVDVGFTGGLVPGNQDELAGMVAAGALAFKCFLAPSGIDEFAHVEEEDIRKGMRALTKLGVPLFAHAELASALPPEGIAPADKAANPRAYATYLASRPRTAEDQAIELLIALSKEQSVRTHVVHLSSATALPLVRAAKDARVPFSVETCPHYLHLSAENVPDGATAFKCAPPIREESNRVALWDALREGLIDQVVTDHSPSSLGLKCIDSGDFMKAWGGISSLQLGLALVHTESKKQGRSIVDLSRWMSERPAELVGLRGKKGVLEQGADADIVVWDPEATFEVDAKKLEHKNPITPYSGERLFGRVERTYLRGERVFERERGVIGRKGAVVSS